MLVEAFPPGQEILVEVDRPGIRVFNRDGSPAECRVIGFQVSGYAIII